VAERTARAKVIEVIAPHTRTHRGVASTLRKITKAEARTSRENTKASGSCRVADRMRRALTALVLGLSALLALVLLPRIASADPRTGYLAEQLRTNDDYRVRTQAALALGASGDDAAVDPLCVGLRDSNVSVRVAAAAALGKLAKPAGAPCLKAALAKEGSASVKSQMKKSLASLESGGGGGSGVEPGPGTKYYVAIQITNKTKRSDGEIDAVIRGAMEAKLRAKAGYAVAPKGEPTSKGGQIVKSKKLKGYFLIATVEAPVRSGGNLTQVVRVSMFTYPDKSLQGEFAPRLTYEGAPAGTASEDELLKMCIENAVETFQKVAASM
jgi:hypothetical protein